MTQPEPAMSFLQTILQEAYPAVERTKQARPQSELERMLPDAPPPRDFAAGLRGGFRLIAEIKKCSPSMGKMRGENVAGAAAAYEASPLVGALSILTNEPFFGMNLGDLTRIRAEVTKPVLRKDFIFDPYQVIEARIAGADAILLMANVVSGESMKALLDLATELGMATLVEVHTEPEIAALPEGVQICGINSRKFQSNTGFLKAGETTSQDFSLEMSAFDLVTKLPAGVTRVAESGLTPENLPTVRERFDAGLVGTSLLRSEDGVEAELARFEAAVGN